MLFDDGRATNSRVRLAGEETGMAKARKKAGRGGDAMIISKTRVKNAVKMNVGSEFYGALEDHVRSVIKDAESRAAANGRKTLRPQDV